MILSCSSLYFQHLEPSLAQFELSKTEVIELREKKTQKTGSPPLLPLLQHVGAPQCVPHPHFTLVASASKPNKYTPGKVQGPGHTPKGEEQKVKRHNTKQHRHVKSCYLRSRACFQARQSPLPFALLPRTRTAAFLRPFFFDGENFI